MVDLVQKKWIEKYFRFRARVYQSRWEEVETKAEDHIRYVDLPEGEEEEEKRLLDVLSSLQNIPLDEESM